MRTLREIFIGAALISALLCYWPGKIQAQTQPFIFQHLDREDGLASSIVLAIMQDRAGFMWFGTGNGLQRYDGRQFIHYRYELNNANSLASDMVEALLQDKNGIIWIASPNQVTRFSPEQKQFLRIPILSSAKSSNAPRHWQLQECNGNILLLSRSQPDAYVYTSARKAFVPVAATGSGSFGCLDEKLKPAVPVPSHEPYVYLKDMRGTVWAAADQLFTRPSGKTAFELVPQNSAFRYGLVFNIIYSLAQNSEGTIWLGTDKGIYYFNPERQRFFTVNTPPGQLNQAEAAAVSGFLETARGEIWVSSLNKGIQVYDPQFRLQRSYSRTLSGRTAPVWCLIEDEQQRVWAGTANGTLLLIKNNKAAIEYINLPVFAGHHIVKVARDAAGTIWWGTSGGLLVQHQPKINQFKAYTLKEQLNNQEIGRIQRILFGPDGSLWIATSQAGVLRVAARTGKIIAHYSTATRPKGLLSNETGEITWYNDSTLAISTNLGLYFLAVKQNQITALTTANGLPTNTILNVVKASAKYLFFTSQFSLSRWNTQTRTITNYGARDGILNESYAFNTGYKLRDGRILLGTLQDFYYFHPDSLDQAPSLPPVVITGFRVFDKEVPLNAGALSEKEIRLAYNQNFFTIEFASLNYYDENKIRYEYQLAGVDPTWRLAGRNRFASYTNLDGGTYQFKVKASRDDGAVTPVITTLNLSIKSPFWKTGWFRVGIILLLMGSIFSLYKLRINRLLALQQVRTRIARDLHDDMGSTLSTISIFSDLANQQMPANPALAQSYLQKISRYSRQMMEAMDDIVWSINPHNDSLQNLISRMREVATELLEAKNIIFCIEADAALNTVRLPLESRYDCFMIFKEALNNIAKYANCRQVQIRMQVVNNTLQLQIADDGQGFNLQEPSGGNGLLNMQKRAQNMKGNLTITSESGKGTTLWLTVPLSKAFPALRV